MLQKFYLEILMNAKIIVDLGFGDSGKGITTDFLCKQNHLSNIVVRFSGGQQAGHNVKIDNISHVHSNYGSGTLRGVPTYFSEHCTVYPVTMLREKVVLHKIDIDPILYIHPLVNVTTPGDIAYNRLTEKKLGHGSCGLGVGATMNRNINTGYKLFGIDLTNTIILEQKLKAIYDYYIGLIDNEEEICFFNDIFVKEIDMFNFSVEKLNINIKSYEFLKNFYNIIFEGSQGILLDMDHGIFPNVTYSNTTSKNALQICKKIGITDIEIFYPTRCYHTRHGSGWMSNQKDVKLINNQDEINIFNEWQKDFKIGEVDYDLLNYALSIDNIYSEGITKNLVVTCLDQRPDFKFDYDSLSTNFNHIYESYSPDSKDFKLIF